MVKKIVITGASGFVGQNALHFFEDSGYECISVSRKSHKFSNSRNIGYDNLESVLKTDYSVLAIIHSAGKAHDIRENSNSVEYYRANTVLTQQVFDAFLQSNASVFIYLSSVKALADKADSILTEDMQPKPFTDYGKSKLAAEEYLQKQILPFGKRLYILRPSMIYGPGNKGNLNLLYKFVNKEIPWPLGAFENQRSYCSIENLLFVVNELIERDSIPSGVYHVADDISLSTNDLISIIAESLNRKPKIWEISKFFIRSIAKFGSLFRLPLNEERLQKLTESYVVSNAKIKSAIGKPFPVISKDGLLKTFKSFQ
ncbi:NAD-dependent epimerase/dehydratase family protein [Sediminibacterium sp. C3]|uniref:NAD-dependent epimerase/dehydratase family protein n=1 Tax=Sediminibacterium sp. C3 TaxID=1267211 RepID=UPI0004045614|nr:NAD-dependent epimerase/dehydratase family protein [Sediminibacterium sp. C3]